MIFTIAFSQEPSAFNSGGSLDAKNEAKLMNEKLFNLSTKIDTLDESQEGLKSVFEGQIQRIQEVTNKIHTMQSENNAAMANIRNHVDSNFALQNENIENLKKSITALSEILAKNNTQLKEEIQSLKDEIYDLIPQQTAKQKQLLATKNNQKDSNPIQKAEKQVIQEDKQNENIANLDSKKDLKKQPILEDKQDNNNSKQDDNGENVNTDKERKAENELVAKNEQETPKEENKETQDTQKAKALEELKNKELALVFKEAEEYLNAKDYELANEYLQFAVKGHYKPARGNYLLGEIAFTQKRYQDAIYYYKVSATRYDKADYIPNLMLNSAKSFIEIKEKDNAKRFLDTLIELYPETKEAEESKKILLNL
ncbi:tetratricopeptide repeat protein [Helicobacter apodemus]|uniref:Tetratricopeptide repeat protein n=2 Tax=Helicobacter apodemus TaxID=135569 RepID=A0A4U8UCS1_9HELI|nr:tetratricopeptide repeat protein [Helicobacter apodemus]